MPLFLEKKEDILSWLGDVNARHCMEVSLCNLSELRDWHYSPDFFYLSHRTFRYFSIIGLEVNKTSKIDVEAWNQPIILQPEIGLLGLAIRRTSSGLQYLVQAKSEPGNLNSVQISPTIQATESNIDRVHGQSSIPLADLFLNAPVDCVVYDALQSEQGGRFFKKRNRNIIIDVTTLQDIHLNSDDYAWISQNEMYSLLHINDVVNMDLRSVLSCLPIDYLNLTCSSSPAHHPELDHSFLHSERFILSWLTRAKISEKVLVQKISLKDITPWLIGHDKIHHPSQNYFQIRGVQCHTKSPNHYHWYQPIIQPCSPGLIVFFVKEIDGLIYFLVQAKLEAGCFNFSELAPTIQCLTGNIDSFKPPKYLDYIDSIEPQRVIYDHYQSEEGGRFYRESNRNMIVKVQSNFLTQYSNTHIWIAYEQLKHLSLYGNMVNVQARCLLTVFDSLLFNRGR